MLFVTLNQFHSERVGVLNKSNFIWTACLKNHLGLSIGSTLGSISQLTIECLWYKGSSYFLLFGSYKFLSVKLITGVVANFTTTSLSSLTAWINFKSFLYLRIINNWGDIVANGKSCNKVSDVAVLVSLLFLATSVITLSFVS